MARREEGGDSGRQAMRVLKRRLSDVIYAALRADTITRPRVLPPDRRASDRAAAPTAPGTRPGHMRILQLICNTADTRLTLDPS